MVQYEVMAEFIKDISMNELELLIDGSCALLVKNGNDSMEELTCVLHHVLTKNQLYHSEKGKASLVLCRPPAIENMPNFIKIYGDLPKRLGPSFFDCVVRVIPMFS